MNPFRPFLFPMPLFENEGAAAADISGATSASDLPDALFFDEPAEEAPAKPASPSKPEEEPEEEAEETPGAEAAEGEEEAKPEGEGEEEETPEDEEPGDGEETESVFTVKVNGEEVEVSETELVKGYMLQADYTRKTQAHAETVRAFEADREGAVRQLQQALAYYALPNAKEPNPADYVGKAEDFQKDWTAWREARGKEEKAQELLEAITAEEKQRTFARESAALLEKVPEWKDDNARKSEITAMVKFGTERYGFTPEEIMGAPDHRLFLLLRDATRAVSQETKPLVLKRSKKVKPKLGAQAKSQTTDKQRAESLRAKANDKLAKGETLTAKEEEALVFAD